MVAISLFDAFKRTTSGRLPRNSVHWPASPVDGKRPIRTVRMGRHRPCAALMATR